MRPRLKTIDQHFGDGVLKIYRETDTASAGNFRNMQKQTLHAGIHYAERTVGYNRYFQGRQTDLNINRLLRIPRVPDICVFDFVEVDGGDIYKIEQIQTPPDVYPASLDLSLSLVKTRSEVIADD